MPFNPYDGTNTPSIGVYTVAPLWGGYLHKYTDPKHPLAYFPATYFLNRNVAVVPNNWKWDFEQVSMTDSWKALLKQLNGAQGFNKIWNKSNGEIFNGKYRTVVFPGNTVHIKQVKYIRPVGLPAQFYGLVDTILYSSIAPKINAKTIPAYLLQHQSDCNYNGQTMTSLQDEGLDLILPLVSAHSMWIPFDQLITL